MEQYSWWAYFPKGMAGPGYPFATASDGLALSGALKGARLREVDSTLYADQTAREIAFHCQEHNGFKIWASQGHGALRKAGPHFTPDAASIPEISTIEEARACCRRREDFFFVLKDADWVGADGASYINEETISEPRRIRFATNKFGYTAPRYGFYTLFDARLYSGYIVITRDGKVIPETRYMSHTRSIKRKSFYLNVRAGVLSEKPIAPKRKIKRPAFLFNSTTSNFAHWHMQGLGNLGMISAARALIKRNPLLLSAGGVARPSYKKQSLDLWSNEGFDFANPERYADENEGVAFDMLMTPSTAAIFNSPSSPQAARFAVGATDWFNQRKAHLPLDRTGPDRVYVMRGEARSRNIVNDEQIQAHLMKRGFSVVEPGALRYRDQIQSLRHARIICGAHGAALSNIIGNIAEPTLVELLHEGQISHWYRNLALRMGARYIGVFGAPERQGARLDWDSNYRMPLETLDMAIDAAEAMG